MWTSVSPWFQTAAAALTSKGVKARGLSEQALNRRRTNARPTLTFLLLLLLRAFV
jgi:hypothetical protein